MTDHYCVFGNPVAHSKSPRIHAEFAAQCGHDLQYAAILAARDSFADSVHRFAAAGGRGANVTVPFKEEAYALANRRTARAERARAVNTLSFADDMVIGDNTDGAGLLRDLTSNLGQPIAGQRLLLLGAGGAARGVLGPLLEQKPAVLVIANRTVDRARDLVREFAAGDELRASTYAELSGQSFALVINATSASLRGDLPPLPAGVFAAGSLAYDMMYGEQATPFLRFAGSHGAARLADGLGMLVEQAAEAFLVWRGVRPQTAAVLALLRQSGNAGGR